MDFCFKELFKIRVKGQIKAVLRILIHFIWLDSDMKKEATYASFFLSALILILKTQAAKVDPTNIVPNKEQKSMLHNNIYKWSMYHIKLDNDFLKKIFDIV